MVSSCCVPRCKNVRVKQANRHIKFYRLPKYNIERKTKWIQAIGRGDDWMPSDFSRVCSEHFVLGEKSDNKLSPNYVPCIFDHTTPIEMRKLLRLFDTHNREVAETTEKISAATAILSIVEEELRVRAKTMGNYILENESDIDTDEEHDLKPDILSVNRQFVDPRIQSDSESEVTNVSNYSRKRKYLKNDRGTQTVIPHDYIRSLEQECSNLRSELTFLQGKYVFKSIELEKFMDADDKIKYLTGLESYKMLKALNDILSGHQTKMFKLTEFQQLLVTLMKLRLGLPFPFLSILFEIEIDLLVQIFIHIVDCLFIKMVPLMITWPDKYDMKEVIPEEFTNCSNYLYSADCFEISVIRTSDTLLGNGEINNSLTNRESDSIHVKRYFMAMAPQGSIIFVSKGRHKDVKYRTIILESDFLTNVSAGDTLVTERELLIEDEINDRGAIVQMSSYMKPKPLSDFEEDGSRGLARIKWVVHSLKQRFQILESEIPENFMKSTDLHSFTILDKIVHVSCGLFNMTNKVWAFDKFLGPSLAEASSIHKDNV